MLLSLPVELQQRVVDVVDPGDIIAFSTSCKRIHVLSQQRLKEHKELSELVKFEKLALSPANVRLPATDQTFSLRSGSPGLLYAIAQTSRLACYFKSLKWHVWRPDGLGDVALESARTLLEKLINASPIIKDESEARDWMEAVVQGRGGAALALLLSQLTQLQRIQMEVNLRDPVTPYVARAISRLATRSQSGFLDQALSALTDARLQFKYDSGSDSNDNSEPAPELIRLLASLTRLPNLQRLSIMDYATDFPAGADPDAIVDWDDADDPDYPLPAAPSQLRSFTVDRGNISAQALARIIEQCVSFETFRYLIDYSFQVFGHRWGKSVANADPIPDMKLQFVCAALLKYAKSSLRRLHLEISDYGGMCGCRHEPCLNPYAPFMSFNPISPPTTNWRWNEFTALERLTLDLELFNNTEDSGGGWLPFAETLPASIRDVTILAHRCPPGTDKLDFENMFRGFKPQAFPNLCSISAWHRNLKDFHTLGHNGPDQILKIYSLALSDAGISAGDIKRYELRSEYFKQRRQQNQQQEGGPISMDTFGFKDEDLYALPAKDTEGTVIFGVYHSEGPNSMQWSDLYDGLAVKKTWG